MTQDKVMQPQLGQLFADFIRRRAIGPEVTFTEGEVGLYQVSGLQPIDPKAALQEAVEAVDYLLPESDAKAFRARELKTPNCWSALVRNQDVNLAVPLCVGNFPQMLRDVTPFLSGKVLSQLHGKTAQLVDVGDVMTWGEKNLAKGRTPEVLLAVASLRMAHRVDEAERLLGRIPLGNGNQGIVENERAALAWHRGDANAARKLWASHSQPQSPAVLFNRGVAALFADRPREAGSLLMQAANALLEKSGWHHLARFYLIVAGNQAAK